MNEYAVVYKITQNVKNTEDNNKNYHLKVNMRILVTHRFQLSKKVGQGQLLLLADVFDLRPLLLFVRYVVNVQWLKLANTIDYIACKKQMQFKLKQQKSKNKISKAKDLIFTIQFLLNLNQIQKTSFYWFSYLPSNEQ